MLLGLFALSSLALAQPTTQIITATSTLPASTVTFSTTGSTILPANVVATTSGLSPQYTDQTTFQSSILNSTNYWRYLYTAPYLTFNSTLASYAQSYSTKCNWQHNPDLTTSRLGENLARGYPDIISSVDAWGNESMLFDYGSTSDGHLTGKGGYTGFSEETGHFTQLVWYETVSVGCGWTNCNGKNGVDGVLLVCNYFPAGNVLGPKGSEEQFFLQNVATERSGGANGYVEEEGASGVGGPSRTGSANGAGATVTVSGAAGALVPGWEVGREGGRSGWVALGVVVGAFMVGVGLV